MDCKSGRKKAEYLITPPKNTSYYIYGKADSIIRGMMCSSDRDIETEKSAQDTLTERMTAGRGLNKTFTSWLTSATIPAQTHDRDRVEDRAEIPNKTSWLKTACTAPGYEFSNRWYSSIQQ